MQARKKTFEDYIKKTLANKIKSLFWKGAIQIIRDTFSGLFRPPPPPM